jgi:hypothetical protein
MVPGRTGLYRRAARRRLLHLAVTILAGLAVWTGILLAPVWTVLGGLGLAVLVGLVNRRLSSTRSGDTARRAER